MTFLPQVKKLNQNDENAKYCSIGGQFRPWDMNQYAVAYMSVCKNVINMTVCDLAGSTETNALEFGDLIVKTVTDFMDLLADHSKGDDEIKRSWWMKWCWILIYEGYKLLMLVMM